MHFVRQVSRHGVAPRLPRDVLPAARRPLSILPPRKKPRVPSTKGDFPLSNNADDKAGSDAVDTDEIQTQATGSLNYDVPKYEEDKGGDFSWMPLAHLASFTEDEDSLRDFQPVDNWNDSFANLTADESTSTFTTVPKYWSNTEQDFWDLRPNGSLDHGLDAVRMSEMLMSSHFRG